MKDIFRKHIKANRFQCEEKNGKNYKNWKWAKLMEQFKPYLSYAKYENTTNHTNETYDGDTATTQVVFVNSDSNDSFSQFHTKIELVHSPEFVEASSSQLLPSIQESSESFNKSSNSNKRSTSPLERDFNDFVHKKRRFGLSPTETIFLGYAQTVETFSPKLQAMTKLKIAQVIMEQEMLHYEEIDVNPL